MIDWVALVVFIIFFLLVTVLGFVAARWRRGDLNQLNEWGLAGRRFGTLITWFLLGGDLYTAYTFVAVPGLVYAVGAQGFYAVPYTILVYPLVYLLMPKFWSVCKQHGYITPSDFVEGPFRQQHARPCSRLDRHSCHHALHCSSDVRHRSLSGSDGRSR